MRLPLYSLLVIAVLAATASAQVGPESNLELKDKVYGTIEIPGDSLEASFYAPQGTDIKLKAKKDGKVDPGVTLTLFAPDESEIPLDSKGKAELPLSGLYRLVMTAAPGAVGDFQVTVNGTPPKNLTENLDLEDGEEGDIVFGVMPDTTLDYKLTNADPVRIYFQENDEVFDLSPFERKQKGILLKTPGDYVFTIEGTKNNEKANLKFKFEKIAKRKVWISKDGFGPEPEIDSIDPPEGLDIGVVSGIEIEGDNFDPDCEVWLEKGDNVIPGTVTWLGNKDLEVSFDLKDAKKGKYKLWIRNPSGAEEKGKFTVIKSSQLGLPNGIEDGTEIWYLEFTDSFEQDLADFGLVNPSGSSSVNRRSVEVVKAYTVYWLRRYFDLNGQTGKVNQSDVKISFIVQEVSEAGGEAGVDYNRIEIGGRADTGAPSDNPNLSWGNVPQDTLNRNVNDIRDPDTEDGDPGFDDPDDPWPTAKLPTGLMSPDNTLITTPNFRAVFLPMISRPISDTDAVLFAQNPRRFMDSNDVIIRYKDYVTAVEALSKEIAAVAAHHIARAMGLPNGDEGIMDTPLRFGDFYETVDLGFTDDELERLQELNTPNLLPGKSSQLRVNPFQMNAGQPNIFEEYGGQTFDRDFFPTGGRPDKKRSDIGYSIAWSAVPLNVEWKVSGHLQGFPPQRALGTYYTDAVIISVQAIDLVDGTTFTWGHRLNILVDLGSIPPQDVPMAQELNRQAVEGPVRTF
jgi:hypothetical protein